MAVNSVGGAGVERTEQVKAERRAQETKDEEKRPARVEEEKEPPRAAEKGRGENMDLTV